MAWVRLDSEFVDHPSIIGLSNDAFRLYVGSIAYCARFYPSTEIPRKYVFSVLPAPRGRWWQCTKELLDANLWRCESTDDAPLTGEWYLVQQDFWVYEFGRNYEYLAHREKVFSRDSYTCVFCGATEDLTLDHIIPISKGGRERVIKPANALSILQQQEGS